MHLAFGACPEIVRPRGEALLFMNIFHLHEMAAVSPWPKTSRTGPHCPETGPLILVSARRHPDSFLQHWAAPTAQASRFLGEAEEDASGWLRKGSLLPSFLQIHETIESINQLKIQRDFMLSFSKDPKGYIQELLRSQSRDLKVGGSGRLRVQAGMRP